LGNDNFLCRDIIYLAQFLQEENQKDLGFFQKLDQPLIDDFKRNLRDNISLKSTGNSGRILFFNTDGKLEWEFINKAKNGKIYPLSWARIIDNKQLIKNILKKIEKKQCK